MKKLLLRTMQHSALSQELGHAIIRVSIGVILLIFGYGKLTSGAENLSQIGSAIAYFGITSGYLFWGYMAALTEFCAGIAFIIGLCTRLMCIPLMLLLIVAIQFHLNKGDTFSTWGFACTLLCVTIGLFVGGSGQYSIDYIFTHNSR